MTIFEDEMFTNKTFEHANLILTEPWVLRNEIMLNIMQNVKFDFLKHEFLTDWCVLSSISKTLHKYSTEFFPMYRRLLELKNDIF